MIDNTADLDAVRVYEHHRPRLWGIAYRMLGSVHDAEDVLQESYLRWHQADTAAVHTPEAWLVRVTTRLAIDRLRRTTAEREHYVGDWLPEPVATDTHSVTERRAEQASDLSMAFLVILERLAPEERAAMLLRDVFDTDYTEIARVLEKSEAACR
jgi:RNA polymerase sigma-70 factor, ECF subfamily